MGACISRNITDTRDETLHMGTVGTYRTVGTHRATDLEDIARMIVMIQQQKVGVSTPWIVAQYFHHTILRMKFES